jgi:hypothetical protein
MRFFTHVTLADSDAAFADYARHWRTVRHFLPDTVSAFERAHTLDRAHLRRSLPGHHDGTLALDFDGWDATFSQRAAIALRFAGVAAYGPHAPAIAADDEVGYWEWDWTGEALELRVLFESSAQLRVVATRFEYEVGEGLVGGA